MKQLGPCACVCPQAESRHSLHGWARDRARLTLSLSPRGHGLHHPLGWPDGDRMVAGGDGKGVTAGGRWQEVMGGMAHPWPSLVCSLCVPSPPRSYSKQRATIDREYGQVRRCHGIQDQSPGEAQAPSCLPGAGTGHGSVQAMGSHRNYPSVAAPCWPWRVVADGSSCQEDPDHVQHVLGALLSTAWPKPCMFWKPGGKTLREEEIAGLCCLLGHCRALL